MMIKKTYFFLLFISFFAHSNTIELEKIFSNRYYYNGIVKNGGIYLGTSNGIYLYNEDNNIKLINPNIKGYIEFENGKFKNNENPIFNKNYNYLLPDYLKCETVSNIETEDKILLCSRGKLLVYKRKNYNFYPIGSTRCFSENFIGTYNGVLYNNKKLIQPSYTSGKIREFENETFICYDGLFHIKNSVVTDYKNNKDFTTEIFRKKIKNSRDIIKISNNEFLLTTTLGLYRLNLKEKKIIKLLSCNNSYFKFLKIESDFKTNRITFFDSKFVYVYSLFNNVIISKKVNENIKDIFLIREDVYYILTNNQLLFYNNGKITIILKNLTETHNVGLFYDLLYITTNSELIIYNIKTKKTYYKFVIDEFNSLAHNIKQDTLYLGSINGYYKFSYDDIIKSINNDGPKFKLVQQKSYSLFYILFGLIMLPTIIFISIKYKQRKVKNPISTDDEFYKLDLKKKILNNIDENINTVTLDSICNDLDLNYKLLYDILKPHKPGDIISNKRKVLVKKLRKMKYSETIISKKTGFSLSYLKKIKP
jgi:hypothetical protein